MYTVSILTVILVVAEVAVALDIIKMQSSQTITWPVLMKLNITNNKYIKNQNRITGKTLKIHDIKLKKLHQEQDAF